MSPVRKIKPLAAIVEQGEFFDALNMNDRYQDKENDPSYNNQHDYEKWSNVFNTTYGHSWFDTISEIFRWRVHIFSPRPYETYMDCISKSEKEPQKTQKFENGKEQGVEWVFKGYIYIVKGAYTDNEVRLLIFEDFDKERRYFEKLKIKFDDLPSSETTYERPRIPENVRIEVWRRDGGKCARCGSREKLEYDHIVPISKGGSNTARNIELLCEKHNRSKSNNVV